MNFGQNVKNQREKLGMTQAELAQILGYKNKASIGKIENGNAEVVVSMAMKIADALHVDVIDLIHGESAFGEFVPYLEKAEEWQLKSVRRTLGMPEPAQKESPSESSRVIG